MTRSAHDALAEAAQHPTFDELMRRDPRTLTKADRTLMVQRDREMRAAWKAKKEKKEESDATETE